jgi:hypothetical protein
MSADRSANERFELTAEIARVERREEEFSDVRGAYQRSLEHFHEQFHSVTRRREAALADNPHSGDGARREWEAQRELVFHVDRYVEESLEELQQVNARVRVSLDDERERLTRERNGLPWE